MFTYCKITHLHLQPKIKCNKTHPPHPQKPQTKLNTKREYKPLIKKKKKGMPNIKTWHKRQRTELSKKKCPPHYYAKKYLQTYITHYFILAGTYNKSLFPISSSTSNNRYSPFKRRQALEAFRFRLNRRETFRHFTLSFFLLKTEKITLQPLRQTFFSTTQNQPFGFQSF